MDGDNQNRNTVAPSAYGPLNYNLYKGWIKRPIYNK